VRDSAYQTASRRFAARSARRARRRRALLAILPLVLASCINRKPVPGLAVQTPPPVGMVRDALTGSTSFLAPATPADRIRATVCLASAIYYEAANEPDEGQMAVAQVVLNRVRHREWPDSVCGVVYDASGQAGCQFSFACDGATMRTPDGKAWVRARRAAETMLTGAEFKPVGSATFYHTLKVAPPWRKRMIPVGIFGAHIFYRMPSDPTDAEALPVRYAGYEPAAGAIVPALHNALLRPTPTLSEPPVAQRGERNGDAPTKAIASPDPLTSTIRPEWRDSGTWIARD